MYAAGVADVDALFGRFDESITLRSMTGGRELAWCVAVVLTDVGMPLVASYARWVLRSAATGSALFILGPRLDPSLLRRARAIEAGGFDLETFHEGVHDLADGGR